jgi:hypothetical protein
MTLIVGKVEKIGADRLKHEHQQPDANVVAIAGGVCSGTQLDFTVSHGGSM